MITFANPDNQIIPQEEPTAEPIAKFQGKAVLVDIGQDGHPHLAKACIPDGSKFGQMRYFTFTGDVPAEPNREFDVLLELHPWTRLHARHIGPMTESQPKPTVASSSESLQPSPSVQD